MTEYEVPTLEEDGGDDDTPETTKTEKKRRRFARVQRELGDGEKSSESDFYGFEFYLEKFSELGD
ncbi:predicted protein [Arabidopsis lyrata subsp. lyrata]|uniref:Predicted protein n=1 Tax=Arabidopsis lyrata subsp. lyrata TaxID=81972 RepID=D7KSV1_ARALL|nr:predicted protein [Arabidopsis lyrata subsp. lyrata]